MAKRTTLTAWSHLMGSEERWSTVGSQPPWRLCESKCGRCVSVYNPKETHLHVQRTPLTHAILTLSYKEGPVCTLLPKLVCRRKREVHQTILRKVPFTNWNFWSIILYQLEFAIFHVWGWWECHCFFRYLLIMYTMIFFPDSGTGWKVWGLPGYHFGRTVITLKNTTSWCPKWKGWGITKVIRINWLGTLDVCTKFHCNPSKRCRDISVWTKQHECHASSMAKNTICWWGSCDVIKWTRTANKWAMRGDCLVDGCFQEWTKREGSQIDHFFLFERTLYTLWLSGKEFSALRKLHCSSARARN